jgi:hypothetical protein
MMDSMETPETGCGILQQREADNDTKNRAGRKAGRHHIGHIPSRADLFFQQVFGPVSGRKASSASCRIHDTAIAASVNSRRHSPASRTDEK